MERFNNWMSYHYDDDSSFKQFRTSILSLNIKNIQGKDIDHYQALVRNAEIIRDSYKEKFDVMLSGGIDSELIVRINHLLGIPQNVFFFKLENDYNILDYLSAKKICNDLNIQLKVINFNLKEFFDNDAEYYYNNTFCGQIAILPRFKFIEMLDNIPVFGGGEPYYRRKNQSDYTTKSQWILNWIEHELFMGIYGDIINRKIIGEWYLYTPEVVLSYHKNKIIKNVLADRVYGKLSTWSSRTEVYKSMFPQIEHKPKLVGYEGRSTPNDMPNFMKDFHNKIIKGTANVEFNFSLKQVRTEFNSRSTTGRLRTYKGNV